MNMNLTCSAIDLWRTPVHITYMCLMGSNGLIDQATGDDAVRALRCYCEWVNSTGIQSASTKEEAALLNERNMDVLRHIFEVRAIIAKPPKDLNVSFV